ncbi:hypothetical protein G6653_09415 [Polynucleobacter paneuropaeus]|jgi:hypothetical protein|nr:hypothetical protein [Polynucleobacter paneuropaeus]MBT8611584.1 hypothetical protein [Polynucleobacter paneuropaeus]
MKDRIKEAILSFSEVSIFIGVIGFLSGIVTLFVDMSSQISLSIRWVLFFALLVLWLTVVLLKVIYDLSREKKAPLPYEHPFEYVEVGNIFIIRRNENFANGILVGCYLLIGEVETLAYLGVVHHVQDTVIQIEIRVDYGAIKKIPSTPQGLRNIIIRPVIPVTAINDLEN